jgi:hypothetical protein
VQISAIPAAARKSLDAVAEGNRRLYTDLGG